MEANSAKRKAMAGEDRPRSWVSAMNTIKPMKDDSMNKSPWAKFTMPIMPNTIV